MNHKLVGFTISPIPFSTHDVDLFDVGLTVHRFTHAHWHVALWGVGDAEEWRLEDGSYTMSFPKHASVLDRNVLIAFEQGSIRIQNDWLGSIPVFYNQATGQISTRMNHVATGRLTFHPAGLRNYLDFGYAVLEHTPIAEIRFLRYASTLTATPDALSVEYGTDPVLAYLDSSSSVQSAVSRYTASLREQEQRTEGTIVIPTSGGYDSRWLNLGIGEKKRIASFTYGVSADQQHSSEVVKAKQLSHILGTAWEHIPLTDVNQFAEQWFALMGCAAHLHGMYQIEFYTSVRKRLTGHSTMLSGIIGDAWAGAIVTNPVRSPDDLKTLSYSHGLFFDSNHCLLKKDETPIRRYYEQYEIPLRRDQFRIITSMRFKITMLNYLMSVPDHCALPSWTPNLNLETVMSILNMPNAERINRKWQQDLFRAQGVMLEEQPMHCDEANTLDAQALARTPIPPLSVTVLQDIIEPGALNALNTDYRRLVKNPLHEPIHNVLLRKRFIGELLRRTGWKYTYPLGAYDQLQILKSLELFRTAFMNT